MCIVAAAKFQRLCGICIAGILMFSGCLGTDTESSDSGDSEVSVPFSDSGDENFGVNNETPGIDDVSDDSDPSTTIVDWDVSDDSNTVTNVSEEPHCIPNIPLSDSGDKWHTYTKRIDANEYFTDRNSSKLAVFFNTKITNMKFLNVPHLSQSYQIRKESESSERLLVYRWQPNTASSTRMEKWNPQSSKYEIVDSLKCVETESGVNIHLQMFHCKYEELPNDIQESMIVFDFNDDGAIRNPELFQKCKNLRSTGQDLKKKGSEKLEDSDSWKRRREIWLRKSEKLQGKTDEEKKARLMAKKAEEMLQKSQMLEKQGHEEETKGMNMMLEAQALSIREKHLNSD